MYDKNYPYGYCGMPCALCTRFHIDGSSRCIGCTEKGYYTEPCKVHKCCTLHCGTCTSFPCKTLGPMTDFSNLNTNHVKERTCKEIKAIGFDAWYNKYKEKAELLKYALTNYNKGRMKRYICELFIQNDLKTLMQIIKRAQNGEDFKTVAEELRIKS